MHVLRTFPNNDRPAPSAKELHVPTYWVRPPQELSNQPGMHRFVWDLHFTPPDVLNRDYPISAIYLDTPLAPQGVLAPPGEYVVRLTVSGHEFMQPLVIKGDPRVKASDEDLQQQYAVQQRMLKALHEDYSSLQELRSLRAQLNELKPRAKGALADSISKLDQQAAAVEGSGAGFGASLSPQAQSLTRLNGALAHIYDVVSLADAAPTTQALVAADQLEKALTSEISKWNEVKKGIAPLNQQLRSGGLPAIDLKKPAPAQAEDEGGGDEP